MQRIGFVVFDGFQSMAFAALSVFETVNVLKGETIYGMRILSEHGGMVRSSVGLIVDSAPFDATTYNTVIVGGGPTVLEKAPPSVMNFMRESLGRSRRVASICTGAFILAEAGILDGRRATTHWMYARDFRSRFPLVKMEEDRIFITDGPVWTSAGMTAGIDLALAMVEKDLGPEIARSVAQKLVLFHRRAGGQSQHSTLLELVPQSDAVHRVLAYAKENLHAALSVEDLAEVACLSPRQFSRVFRAETGQSPAKAVENLRLETARWMLEQTGHSIDEVAKKAGFADRRRMREVFLRAYAQPPQVIRRNARATSVALAG